MFTICYKTKIPEVYNKGSEYECYHDTFLAYYTCGPIEKAQAEADKLNETKPTHFFNGLPIDWDNIDYFYAGEQEMFDTRDSFGVGDWR